jgi:hypothetical protein
MPEVPQMNAKVSSVEPEAQRWYSQDDKTSATDDERILDITPLPPPEHLIRFFPIRGTAMEGLITQTRQRIRRIMQGQDDRLLVVIGPCSIHDPTAALEYARRLVAQRETFADTLARRWAGRASSTTPTSTRATASTRGCASRASCCSRSTAWACRPAASSWT